MFLTVTIYHILKNINYELCFLAGSFVNQITTGKKGTVVWSLVRMFGGSMSSDCFGRFLDQITTGKKGTVVWLLVAMFGGSVPWAPIILAGSLLCFLAGSLIKLPIMTRNKWYSWLAIGWNVYYVLLTYYTLVDRPSAMTPWGIYPGRKIPALTWGPVNNVEPDPAKSEPPPKQSAGKICGASSRLNWAASKTIQ